MGAMRVLDAQARGFEARLLKFINEANDRSDYSGAVSDIVSAVGAEGDAAVLRFTERFDGVRMQAAQLRIPESALKDSVGVLSKEQKQAFKAAVASVTDFHRKTLPRSWTDRNGHGAMVGERFYPIQRVGLYVPGGQVPLASSVVMTTVLAKIAGVPSIAVATPPLPGGSGLPSPVLMAALYLSGMREVYAIGGAQAIAAMALGTDSIPAVDKVFGPGNAFVNEAKRQLFGRVGIDLQPGPSEVMVIADATASPSFVAADILAQAEHGTGKEKVYLAVPSRAFLKEVEACCRLQMESLNHKIQIEKVLQFGALAIICSSDAEAIRAANLVAPEHLELQVDPKKIAMMTRLITTAGAILQGHCTPTVLGDFVAGPSHTLPTGRTSRFFSGLQVTDFMRRSSIVRYDAKALRVAAPIVEVFSSLERLDAHGRSLKIRLDS